MPERRSQLTQVPAKLVRRTAVHVASPAYAGYRRARARGAPRVLVYADSRATNVTGPLGKSVFGTYVSRLMGDYRLYPVILPRRHTTLVDFLNYWDGNTGGYDAIVLHCGIVDFSPRPVSSIQRIAADKASDPGFAELFADNGTHHRDSGGPRYRGEPTTTIYSPDYLERRLVPRLRAVPNMLWVTTNDFVPGWDGNYSRGRPADIAARIAEFEARLSPAIDHVVDLHGWSHDEIKRYTIDNIHFTATGFDEVARVLRARIDELLGR